MHNVFNGEAGDLIARTHIQAFLELDRTEPGLWSLAQGEIRCCSETAFLTLVEALVELHRAIPVPDKDVPLDDILNFRTRRRDELIHLRNEIGSLFTQVNDAADKQFALLRHIGRVDSACADLLKVTREWRCPFRLSDLKVSFELRPFAALAAGAGGWQWGVVHDMPLASAAVSVAASLFKINKDFGLHGIKLRSNPYRYVCRFHEELF